MKTSLSLRDATISRYHSTNIIWSQVHGMIFIFAIFCNKRLINMRKQQLNSGCPGCVSVPVPAASAYYFVSFRYLSSSLFLNTGKPKCLHVSHLKLPGTSTVTRTLSLGSPSPPAPSATLAPSPPKKSHSNMYFLLKYYHLTSEFILFTNLNLYSYGTLGRTVFYINYQNISDSHQAIHTVPRQFDLRRPVRVTSGSGIDSLCCSPSTLCSGTVGARAMWVQAAGWEPGGRYVRVPWSGASASLVSLGRKFLRLVSNAVLILQWLVTSVGLCGRHRRCRR